MTSPVIVGSVGVEVTATAKGFARRLRDAVVKEFQSAGLDKALQDALGNRKIKIPVEPEFDPKSFPRTLPNVPKAPSTPRRQNTPDTDTDALIRAFQADVQRQLRALSKDAVRIPIRPDTDQLRADLARQIGDVQRHLTVKVPTEPGGRGDYERSLQQMLTDVSRRVRATVPPAAVPVKLDPLTRAFQADVQKQITVLSRTANLRIPVSADTAGVRARIAAEVAAIERTLKAEVPTEPGSRLAYEAKLRAMVAQATRTVRASIPVDIDRNRFQRAVAAVAAKLPEGLGSALQRVGEQANSAGSSIASMVGQAAAGLAGVVNPATLAAIAIGGTVAALLTVGPAASIAAGGLGVLSGALASLPAIFVGGASIVGAFGLALHGVADQFKQTARSAGGGGQSTAAAGRQIAAAQRGIGQAQRGLASAERNYRNALADTLRAQQAVNEARRQAVRRIEDLGRALRGAALNERDAALRVREAQEALQEAYATRDPLQIERAQLDLEQAQFAAEEAARATKDAADAKTDADRKGIEGSDEVTAALERQRSANDQLLAAADGLKSAQEGLVAANESLAAAQEKAGGSAGGLGKKLVKLAPAAQKFVDAVKGLKPAFEDLRLDVQQRLFAGLDKTVRKVGQAWLPQLHETLGSYATTFNGFFKNLGKNITQPEFMRDMAAGAESMRQAMARVGQSITGPLVDAFGRLTRAAKPFTDAFGDEVSKLVEDFSAWIKSADKSGKLQTFFQKTSGYLRDFFKVGRSVGSIFKSLMVILFGADAGKGSGVVETFQKLADFLNDPENRKQIAEWVAKMKEFGRILLVDVIPAILGFLFWVEGLEDKITGAKDAVVGFFTDIKRTVSDWTTGVLGRLGELPDQIEGAIGGLADQIGGYFSTATTRATNVVGGWLTRAQQQFASLRGRVSTALSSVPGTMGGLLQSAVNRGAAVLGTLAGRAGTAVSNVGARIRSTLSGLRGDLYNIGRNVVLGLWDGIGSLTSWLGDRIRNWAHNRIVDFQNGFGVASPSKLMASEVGRWLPPGLAAGMDQAIGTVEAARDRMIAAAIPDVSETYALNIAPVVDPDAGGTAAVPAPASSQSTARIEFVGDAPGSFMRWIKENVRISHGGDANQAFGRAPTPALAK